ncbi:MAG: GNAT family N-acetyltransferase [Desulfosarcinaceae bacterium]
MLKIRRIYDDVLPVNREILKQVQQILRTRFQEVTEDEIALIGEKLRNPFKQRFRTILLVAENLRRRVLGFAMLLHEPEIKFCYLDWIALAKGTTGGGLGSALYDRVRIEASGLNALGLFFECLPDDPQECPEEGLIRENRSRLRFYERYGARPIINTGYDYVDKVVASFKDDPVQLRPFRYVKPEAVRTAVQSRSIEQVALVINDKHDIHHIHERGYVESPVRISHILESIEPSGLFAVCKPRKFPEKHLYAVHDSKLVHYLRRACEEMPEGKSLYPYIFPIRNKARPPREPSVLAGYYCIDTFTPINRNAYPAARRGVDCSLTAAEEILSGRRIAYALVRPPGHHAEKNAFGGFCYFNNNAVAAHYLSGSGKVAILDIDYHHGNGQQDIFYQRADVLTISIHGHPRFAYPYFSGFEEERGQGEGEGFNMNLPLPEAVDGPRYRKALEQAVHRIEDFRPQFLVIALGLDTAKGDPTGTWQLQPRDFERNGRMLAQLALPTLVIQEGGYKNRTLGINAYSFFNGLVTASPRLAGVGKPGGHALSGVAWRREVQPPDPERIERLVEVTGFFSPQEIDVAVELVHERLAKGEASGYHFLLAEHYGRLVGYACYGPTPCTLNSFDLYWIAVHPDFQRRGLGRRLVKDCETLIAQAGGQRVYVDTSQRIQYASTRAFYESCGYRQEGLLRDFYAPGDGKVIYCKVLAA